MKKALMIVTGLLLCLSGLCVEDPLLQKVMTQYQGFMGGKFSVDMYSNEINTLVSQAVAAKTAQMMGIPLNIKVKHFTLSVDKNIINTKIVLDCDEDTRKTMEPQANQMLKSSGFTKVIEELSLGALSKVASVIKARGDEMEKSSNQKDNFLFKLENLNEKVLGILEINMATMSVNSKYNIINGLRFDFSDGSAAIIKYVHNHVNDRICPTVLQLEHNLKIRPAGLPMPGNVFMTFKDYDFQ